MTPRITKANGRIGNWLLNNIYKKYNTAAEFARANNLPVRSVYNHIKAYSYPNLLYLGTYSREFRTRVGYLIDMLYLDQQDGVREKALMEKENKK